MNESGNISSRTRGQQRRSFIANMRSNALAAAANKSASGTSELAQSTGRASVGQMKQQHQVLGPLMQSALPTPQNGAPPPPPGAPGRRVPQSAPAMRTGGGASAVTAPRSSARPPTTPQFFRSPGIFMRNDQRRALANNPFDSLSDDVLLELFAWLPKTALVRASMACSRFRAVSTHQSLWRRLDLANKIVSESSIHSLLSRGLHCLRLAKADMQADVVASPLLHEWSALRYLDLSMAVYADASTSTAILRRCRHLKALSLEHCLLDDEGCRAVAENGQLEYLNLAMCYGLTSDGFRAIVDACQKLKELNVAWSGLDAAAVTHLCSKLAKTVVRLNVSGLRDTALVDSDVSVLIANCEGLIELDVSDCTKLTGVALDALLNQLAKLAVLHMSRCYGVEPLNFTSCHKLTELNIFGCVTDDGYDILAERLPRTAINGCMFSTVARPTVGIRRTSIWLQRVRDVD